MPGDVEPAVPLIDWFVLLLVLGGTALGAVVGLSRAFALLLWTLAALWLGHHLSARVVDWMPNSADPADPVARAAVQRPAFATIAALVLALPLAARLLGGPSGRKKAGAKGQQRAFGGLVGLVVTLLLLTLALPLLHALPVVGDGWEQATSPAWAAALADNVAWLFPAAHREALLHGGVAG